MLHLHHWLGDVKLIKSLVRLIGGLVQLSGRGQSRR